MVVNISQIRLRYFYSLVLLLLLLPCFSYSQSVVDEKQAIELEEKLNKLEGDEYFKAISSLAKYYSKYDASKASILLYNSIDYAQSIDDTLNYAKSHYLLGVLFQMNEKTLIDAFDSSKAHYFDALIILGENKYPHEQFFIYSQLSRLYELKNNKESYLYLEKALKIAEEYGYDKKLVLKLAQKIAFMTLKLNEYNKTIYHSLRIINILDNEKREKEKIPYLNYLGDSYYNTGNYQNALNYYFKELELRRKYDDNPLNDDFLDKIAKVYISLENYSKALQYYNNAVNIHKSKNKDDLGDKYNIVLGQYYSKIGLVYYMMKDYNKSISYYKKALNVTGSINSEESLKGKIIIYNNLALNYKALGNLSKAIENVDKSEEIITQLGVDGFEFFTLTSLAEIYSKLNDFEAAESYLLKAIETAKLNDNTSKLKDAQFLLYELYTKFKKFEKALETYKSYKLLTDSIINYDMTERLAEFQTVYEMEKRNQENDALKTANRLQRENARLERQSFILTSLISLLVIIVLMVLFYIRKRASNVLVVSNNIIEGQNARLLELNENLRKKESGLRHSNNTKDKFISIIAHDLKNPMHSIGFSADLMINYYETLNDDKKKNHLNGILKTSTHTYELLENLLDWARAQSKSMSFEPKKLNYMHIVRNAVELSISSAQNKQIDIIDVTKEEFEVFADKNMVDAVLRNLISNSIKFSHPKSKILIKYKKVNDYIVTTIQDFGVGITQEKQNKLFRIEEQVSTPGTNKESGTGLGLLLCKEFITINKGDIWVESEEGVGSEFKFTLPISEDSITVSKETIQHSFKTS